MNPDTIVLPQASAAPRRPPMPVLAAVIPVVGGAALWMITGSILSLCFAALGPLMLGASFVDGLRVRRRDLRLTHSRESEQWAAAERELRRAHARERDALRRAYPDTATCLAEPPLRGASRMDGETLVLIGTGATDSAVRVSGGDGQQAREFRDRASRLTDAPIAVPVGGGICVRAPRPVADAIVRAIVVQLCLRFPPAQLAVCGDAAVLGLADLPHAARPRRDATRLMLHTAEAQEDGGQPSASDVRLYVREPGDDVPEGVSTVLDCSDPAQGSARTAQGTRDVAVECLSEAQARAVVARSGDRGSGSGPLPDIVHLGELRSDVRTTAGRELSAVIGVGERGPLVLDLVAEGPHAIVTGVTGSGKSELLVTWVASMAREHGPRDVVFVLADFKGGTAFDPLRTLPHVTALMTDLDEEGARRGVQSLTAELRRREAELGRLGVRDVAHSAGALPRLVIVVDEFAALLQEHPDLGAVFVDIAARGRALGMHLVLGTQRASGVIRDALAANCPLRVSLRVTDAADSRLVIGSEEASRLPGGPDSRGLALVRRPQDDEATAIRVALTDSAELERIRARWAGEARPPSPWLPALPARIELSELAPDSVRAGRLVLGLADDPDRQSQSPVCLHVGVDRGMAIIGGSGSGRSSAIRALRAQCAESVVVPLDPEAAWDTLAGLVAAESAVGSRTLVLCDDLDRLVGSFPPEHAQVFLERMEELVRTAGACGRTVVVAAGRTSGPGARVWDALPERLLLRMHSRMEHLAAGGDGDAYRRDRQPGRGRLDDREVQVAWTEPSSTPPVGPTAPVWQPEGRLIAVVAAGVRRTVEALRRAHPGYEIVAVGSHENAAAAAAVAAGLDSDAGAGPGAVFVGDADSWQRNWTLWQRAKREGELLIVAECPSELRTLAGVRGVPPFARTHAGRAWSVRDGSSPRRVLIAAPATGESGRA